MACTHCDNCELYAQFALNPALKIWQTRFCQGEYSRCVRFQMSLRKESVPLNMLPNGQRVEIPRTSNDYNATALFNAILKARLPLLESLLKSGIDINVRNSDGNTPLMAAASTGNLDMINLLIRKGAIRSIRNNLGETAEQVATRYGHSQAAAVLRTTNAAENDSSAKPRGGGFFGRLRGTR